MAERAGGKNMDGRTRLVYTTEQEKMHNNVQYFDESLGKEAGVNMRETIQEINKSRRRTTVKRNITGLQIRSQEQSKKKDEKIESVINYLAGGSRTYAEIYKHLFPNDRERVDAHVTYVRNLMNQIKIASDSIIFSEKGLWMIDPKYVSFLSVLIQTTQKNKSKIWRKYDEKKTGVAPARKKSASRPASENISNVSNKMVTRGTKIVISGDQEAITVPLKIALTIQVKIEVIQ